ncbi:MAG: DUF3299 domain-containing protein [Rhodobacteraceae bacterium]|jgi:hypothetical protein|uniref:DUF3299 domain-containing protein n=1 Tax=Planktotalea sp. TaxID=2029877 RepID=UPI001DED43A1|nr:DUF3299 domain-containing protein [Planktotalea sp.]MBT5823107.1 DUF3299 domain-containing protein [Paracoccaceae bacterium]MDG1085810.1 DUF3299 domain-containing protein [Planktotalea sp.]
MLNRRSALMLFSGALATPKTALAATPKEITWDDLLPVGVPYSEIIGEGELDEVNDTWNPIYDENATKLNESLDGSYIKMPGFIIPFDIGVKGVTEFMLVPYTGACIHMPPPPANQLVMVNAKTPWPSDDLWNPVWVIGMMRMQLQTTDLGQTGYAIVADQMEVYEW